MQDSVKHFKQIVLPAISDFEEAEAGLARAISENEDPAKIDKARYTALRLGGAAATYLHYFADIVAKRSPAHLPNFQGSAKRVRRWLEHQNLEIADGNVTLLKEVVEALERAVLTQETQPQTPAGGQILTVDPGPDAGQGKHGMRQVWVIARKKRTLSSVLSSVSALWKLALKLP